MKRLHFLLLGLLVSLTIAAVSPTLPPTRLIAGNSSVTIVTNGVNNFTLTAGGGNPATNLVVRQSSGNALTVNTNVLVVATNKVGFGNAVPLAPIHVGDYTAMGSADAQVLIAREVSNGSGSGNAHAFADNTLVQRSGSIGYNSFDAKAIFGGGVDYDHYAGYQSRLSYNNTPGVMLNYYGYHDALSVGSGTVKTNFGVYLLDPAGGGVVEENYGVYIAPKNVGTVANYSIYADGTNKSVFGGTVKVGQLQFSATAAGAADVGVFRYSGDVIEINNGTIGNRRDLMLRALWDAGGNQVVSARQAAVADAAGGAVIDVEARAALNDLLAKLRTHGLIAP